MWRTSQRSRRLWCVLNVVGLILVLGFAGAITLAMLAFGTDHSRTPVDEWALTWVVGAAAGLLTVLIVGRYDPRYRPWTAALMLAGVVASTMSGMTVLGVPFLAVALLLAASLVLHARTGRHRARVHAGRGRVWTGVVVTGSTLAVVGAATAYVVVGSRPTPGYEAMQADPMAADRLPGMAVRYDSSQDRTTSFGMTSGAEVSRVWTITDATTRSSKLEELAILAGRSGWSPSPDTSYCGWRKVVDGYPMCLVLRPGVEADEVIIEITHDDTGGVGADPSEAPGQERP